MEFLRVEQDSVNAPGAHGLCAPVFCGKLGFIVLLSAAGAYLPPGEGMAATPFQNDKRKYAGQMRDALFFCPLFALFSDKRLGIWLYKRERKCYDIQDKI